MIQLRGYAYLAGGLLFGIASSGHTSSHAGQQLSWQSAGLLSVVLALMPDAFYRFLAVANGVAMIGLGVFLWRSARTEHNAADIGSPRSSRHGSSLTELGSA